MSGMRRHEECIRAREEDEKGHEKEAEMMNQEKGNRNGKESLLKKDEETLPETNGKNSRVEQEKDDETEAQEENEGVELQVLKRDKLARKAGAGMRHEAEMGEEGNAKVYKGGKKNKLAIKTGTGGEEGSGERGKYTASMEAPMLGKGVMYAEVDARKNGSTDAEMGLICDEGGHEGFGGSPAGVEV